MPEFFKRLFGDSVKSSVLQLVLLCIFVGFILATMGFNPYNLFYSIERLFRFVLDSGWDIVEALWRYLLLGAVIVVPLWFIIRMFSSKKP
jgi:NADH:ubiquinone oxidoreductase subunit 5 (subunit L)/multisubunit Na+/H+ antiporter MnhA subunit